VIFQDLFHPIWGNLARNPKRVGIITTLAHACEDCQQAPPIAGWKWRGLHAKREKMAELVGQDGKYI